MSGRAKEGVAPCALPASQVVLADRVELGNPCPPHHDARTPPPPHPLPPLSPSLCSITFDPAAEEAKEAEVQILTAELTRAFNLAGGKLKRLACEFLRLDAATRSLLRSQRDRSCSSHRSCCEADTGWHSTGPSPFTPARAHAPPSPLPLCSVRGGPGRHRDESAEEHAAGTRHAAARPVHHVPAGPEGVHWNDHKDSQGPEPAGAVWERA